MLTELKFVQGAVAKKDYNPTLTHFEIKNKKIKGTNGSLTICSPIALDIEAKPKALPFVKAIQSCKGNTVQIHVTPTGRLSVKSGKFKSLIECTTEDFPDIEPEGTWVSLTDTPILPALKKLLEFTAEDASRPWALGVMFRGDKAFATNNIILLEYSLGFKFPVEVNIPKFAVAEIVRVGKEPIGMMVTATSVTFMYDQFTWIRTQLYQDDWPDVGKVLDKEVVYDAIPENLFDDIEQISPFVDDTMRVILKAGSVTTAASDESSGATVENLNIKHFGVFNFKQFMRLNGLVTEMSFASYPAPCLFKGENVRGAFIGMRCDDIPQEV